MPEFGVHKFVVVARELDDPALTCDDCGDTLCTIESGDDLGVLLGVADDHVSDCVPKPMCDECDERIGAGDFHAGHGMCGACLHDALRSGWSPYADEEVTECAG